MFKGMVGSLAIAASGLVAAAPAQAHVSFSFGIEAPVYAAPPVYYEPPVYYRPAPAYDLPPRAVYVPGPRDYGPPLVYRPYPDDGRYRDGWDRGYDRQLDEHRRWHEEHHDRGRRDDDDRD